MNKEKLSNCCKAPIRIAGTNDFPSDKYPCTMYYECTKCGNPCNIWIKENFFSKILNKLLTKKRDDNYNWD